MPVFPFPARSSSPRPRSSVHTRYRNLNLLSIGYASPPRLRPRLPQGRSALPWNPWIFGRGDSHPPLATHSGILPSYPSTAPSKAASPVVRMLPYRSMLMHASRGFGGVFQPRTFSAQGLSTSELLRTLSMRGCFWANVLAVFESPHPFPLNTHLGALAGGLGSFPLGCPTYLVQPDSQAPSLWHSEFDILW